MSAMGSDETIEIFFASPNDIDEARTGALAIAEKLQRRLRHRVTINFYNWEDAPLPANLHFQAGIPSPANSDITVVFFGSRLGSLLDADEFPGPITGKAVTGTEFEYEAALAGYDHSGGRKPNIIAYWVRPENIAFGAQSLDESAVVFDFVRRWFEDERTKEIHGALRQYPTATAFLAALESHLTVLIEQVARAKAINTGRITWQDDPYVGLTAFTSEQSTIFSGRASAVNELVDKVRQSDNSDASLTVIIGPSGSGKSSLINAGLVPALQEPNRLPDVLTVRRAVMRPSDALSDPVAALAHALVADELALPEILDEPQIGSLSRLVDLLREEEILATWSLSAAIGRLAGPSDGEARLVLVIDQLEELATDKRISEPDRLAFMRVLSSVCKSGGVLVVAALRSDFVPWLVEPDGLGAFVRPQTYLLSRPTLDELRDMVLQPARLAGYEFEELAGVSLDRRIARDAEDGAASLPLLQYTLKALVEASDSQKLTFAAYEEMEGLYGSVGREADAVFKKLPADQQAALPRVLRDLTTMNSDDMRAGQSPVTAQRQPLDQYPEGTPERGLIDAFHKARLIVIEGDENNRRAVVTVAHEALLTHWDRAVAEIQRNQGDIIIQSVLERARQRWEREGQSSDLLLRGSDLHSGRSLMASADGNLPAKLAAFIRRSINRARFWFASGATIILVVLAGLGISAWMVTEASQRTDQLLRVTIDNTAARIEDIRTRVSQFGDADQKALDATRATLERAERALEDQNERSRLFLNGVFNAFLAQMHGAKGEVGLQRDHAISALTIFGGLPVSFPGEFTHLREKVRAHAVVGDAERQLGSLTGALVHLRAAGKLAERLPVLDETSLRAWTRQIEALHGLGDALFLQGSLTEAFNAYNRALTIRAETPDRFQDEPILRQLDSKTYYRLALVHRKRDETGEALRAARKDLDITRELNRELSYVPEYQRDLAISLRQIVLIHLDNDERAAAWNGLEEAVSLVEALRQRAPGDLRWLSEYAAVLETRTNVLRREANDLTRAGAVAAARERRKAFLTDTHEVIAARKKILDQDNDNVEAQLQYGNGLNRLARYFFDESRAFARQRSRLRHIGQDPGTDPDTVTMIMPTFTNVGKAATSSREMALEVYTDVLSKRTALRDAYAERQRGRPDAERRLPAIEYAVASSYSNQARAQELVRDRAAALAAYREAEAIRAALVKRDPTNAEWQAAYRSVLTAIERLEERLREQ